ncbi:MFS transporter [Niallia sp. 03133]|uniref:MFS transporter n=1 Tax=Niallia sp. 03133 TaxID=3458060 RepID=UPI004044B609
MSDSEQINSENEKWSIRNGVFTTVILNISTNYFPLFAISVLGASNYEVGLMSSLPQFIGMFAMVIGSIIISRLKEKKMFTVYSFFAARLFLIAMAFVFFLPKQYQSMTFILLVSLMNFPFSFATLGWQALIADIISEKRRNAFFSNRNRVMTFIGMISTFIIGFFLQLFDKTNAAPYQFLYIAAFICGLLEIFYLKKHKEKKQPILQKLEKKPLFDISVFKHKPFFYFLLCSLFFNFGWQMCWSLFSIYQIKYAGATGLWISLFAVANSIGQVVSFKWWGKMADKYTNTKMLIYVSIGMASAPFLTVLSTNLVYIVLVNIFAGLFVSGTVLLLFNLLLESTEEKIRSQCIANYNILLALIAFVAPQFGVYILEMTNIVAAMYISSVFRALSGVCFFLFYIYLKRKQNFVQKQRVDSSSVTVM